ncbi:MAG: 23S rRNA (adenine(2503)-C(2))-methyltransferase RlmN [Opitutales bacterium]|nr:23S rRNA (adenine(2503)-C(2))-methyltransferase RlmN [Opitutales bacterium]
MAVFKPEKESLYAETLDSLTAKLTEQGLPSFRAGQIMDWLYRKGAKDFDSMSNLPLSVRKWLADSFCIMPAQMVLAKAAGDVTEKLLLELEDGSYIETVILRAPEGDEAEDGARQTLCVSSQVGCAYGCKFCASGLDGWKRNLLASEIIAQVMTAAAHIAEQRGGEQARTLSGIDNIVFMGMGEPLANFDNVVRAVEILHAQWGLGLGARRITISTSGIAPQILKLAEVPVQFRLAVSLHGATNEVRGAIMPVNKAYPLEVLVPAIKKFAQTRGRMVTLEYILIEDVNDALSHAAALADITRELHAHVNLIPYNPVPNLPWKRPNYRRQKAFAEVLSRAKVSFTIRRQKGDDIDAACGQLRLRMEKERTA